MTLCVERTSFHKSDYAAYFKMCQIFCRAQTEGKGRPRAILMCDTGARLIKPFLNGKATQCGTLSQCKVAGMELPRYNIPPSCGAKRRSDLKAECCWLNRSHC